MSFKEINKFGFMYTDYLVPLLLIVSRKAMKDLPFWGPKRVTFAVHTKITASSPSSA